MSEPTVSPEERKLAKDSPSRVLMVGNRHRSAAVRSLQRAATQLAACGNLNGSLAALELARTVTEDLIDRYQATIEVVRTIANANGPVAQESRSAEWRTGEQPPSLPNHRSQGRGIQSATRREAEERNHAGQSGEGRQAGSIPAGATPKDTE